MAKLEKRVAYYSDGRTEAVRTPDAQLSQDKLIGIVQFYNDGTRQLEGSAAAVDESDQIAVIAKLRLEKNLEFKYDDGDTPEIYAMQKVRL